MQLYYYLDKTERLGPIELNELVKLNLDPETLVWTEGYESWKKLKEVKEICIKLPPPIPKKVLRKKNRNYVYTSILALTLIAVLSTLKYLTLTAAIKESKNELTERIEKIFSGKNMISDGINYSVSGEMKTLRFTRQQDLDFGPSGSDDFPSDFKDYEFRSLCLNRRFCDFFVKRNGGFFISTLSRSDNGYIVEKISSRYLAYKKNKSFGPSVQKGFNTAYSDLMHDKESHIVDGSIDYINALIDYRSSYHYLSVAKKPTAPNAFEWGSQNNLEYQSFKIYFDKYSKYYEVVPIGYNISKSIKSFVLICLLIIIPLILLNIIFNPFKW